jgi:hypothetical protein
MKKSTLPFYVLFLCCALGTVAFGQTKFSVNFSVDMSESEEFNPETDEVYISGTFADWAKPGDDLNYKLIPGSDQNVYELTLSVDSGEMMYKYYRVIDGEASWDNSEWEGDPDRKVILTEALDLTDTWGDKPIRVNFWIDLMDVEGFNPAIESLYISGDFTNDWAMPGTIPQYKMSVTGEVDDYIYYHPLFLYRGDYEYKYYRIFHDEPSWDHGEGSPGLNRQITVIDTTWMTVKDVWIESSPGIFESKPKAEYVIRPNPATDKLHMDELFDVERITIFDVAGNFIKSIEISSINLTLNTSDLNSGMYIIAFHTGNGVRTSQFVVH